MTHQKRLGCSIGHAASRLYVGFLWQTTRGRDEGSRIRVYFVVYEDSVEEQRYLTTLK